MPILDHFNVTLPALVVFLFIPTIKLRLDLLEAELKKQTQDVANISMNFRGSLKEASSKDQSIFFIHLVVQIINCSHDRQITLYHPVSVKNC